jgi:RNA polymerase sigma-70 factor (ECF subfamily)
MSDTHDRESKLQLARSRPATPEPNPGLEEIFRRHKKQVLTTAYRVTGNAQDAEDVLQTIFMRLARQEGGSPLSSSPGGYLHRASINAALDVVRSRKSARSGPLEDVEATLASVPAKQPDRLQDASEIRQQVRQALSELSPKSAEIFTLRYFEGYGNNEIATMLGTSRSTINVILHRTRQRLKEKISDYVGEGS